MHAAFRRVLECLRTKDGLKWTWQRRCYHPVDEPFELGYEISTTTFTARTPGEPADWRDAADIYKQWALEQPWCAVPYAQRTDVPDWMKAGPSMIRFHRDWLGKPERVEGWLYDYWQKHFPDVPLIVALWGWERVGSWVSPKYFPPYPSEAGFSRTVAAAQRVGGHAFPWPSGYYWNVEYQENADGTFAVGGLGRFQRHRSGARATATRRHAAGAEAALAAAAAATRFSAAATRGRGSGSTGPPSRSWNSVATWSKSIRSSAAWPRGTASVSAPNTATRRDRASGTQTRSRPSCSRWPPSAGACSPMPCSPSRNRRNCSIT